MAFNEKLQQNLEEAQGVKPFSYDSVLKENSEFNKQHTLLQVKLTALLMEENDAYLWWDAMHDIVQKDIGKVYKYEPLILYPKLETSYEEKNKGNINGVRPSNI